MPNWCTTNMRVTGPQEDVIKFTSGFTAGGKFLESYLPCPTELRETISGSFVDEDKAAELKLKSDANQAKYGYPNWYEWQLDVWGAKWGDCDTVHEEDILNQDGSYSSLWTFQTPWGPATQGWKTISAMFPTLVFQFSHDEEAGFFEGYEVMQNNELIFEKMYAPTDYPDEIDDENEESYNKYIDWKLDQMDIIDAELAEFYKERAKVS